MKPKRILTLLSVLMALVLAASCAGKGDKAGGETGAEFRPSGGLAWPVLALLKTGLNPLWFELGPDGPGLIESPAAAALMPFAPWPHARHITAIQEWDGFLVMPVNRDGFLVLGAAPETTDVGNTDIFLYRAAAGLWDSYTTESFFLWEDKPAILLYRNDFFTELSAPPINPQVYVLDKASAVPFAVFVPALESFPSGGPWETELVHPGPGGFWFYRMREKGKPQGETAYFRTPNLTEAGEKISAGEWRNSSRPDEKETDFSSFTLPALPEGFAYTGAAALGDVIAASWEEQQEASIGAAGFMVMARVNQR